MTVTVILVSPGPIRFTYIFRDCVYLVSVFTFFLLFLSFSLFVGFSVANGLFGVAYFFGFRTAIFLAIIMACRLILKMAKIFSLWNYLKRYGKWYSCGDGVVVLISLVFGSCQFNESLLYFYMLVCLPFQLLCVFFFSVVSVFSSKFMISAFFAVFFSVLFFVCIFFLFCSTDDCKLLCRSFQM